MTQGGGRLAVVLVVPPHPVEPLAPLVPPLGHQIEVVVRRVEQVDAARVGRVGMKHPAYARGIDLLNAAYNYLDLVPKGRDEGEQGMYWLRRHDEYDPR